MALLEHVRPGAPRDHLVSGAYHTPSGHLHLGHLGGPFLSADVVARHLQTLGHGVVRITSTDAFEAYVLLTALLERRPPAEVAHDYWASARDALAAFDLHYDTFIDFSADPWRSLHHEHCHDVARHMTRRGRAEVVELPLARSRRSGRFLVGPFALGRCPHCGAEAAGSACEACGMWFGPGELRELHPRLEADADPAPETVPVVHLRAPAELTAQEASRRFPTGYDELFERFLAHRDSRLHVTHPLGWGVPWRAHEIDSGSVHVSYGTGSYAATVVTGLEYQRLTGAEVNPFDRSSDVVTILTGGYDAAVPCLIVLALRDEESVFDPYRHHVLSRFMLLEGRKFSTSAGHVIRGSAYVEAGLPTDLFRLYAARLFSAEVEGDFVPSAFAGWIAEFAGGRLEPAVAAALARAEGEPPPLAEPVTAAVAGAFAAQAEAMALPDCDVRAAAEAIDAWLEAGEAELSASAPYWWLKTLAVLAWPFMPRWGEGLWRALGADGTPSLDGFERAAAPRPDLYAPLPGVTAAQLARLTEPDEGGP